MNRRNKKVIAARFSRDWKQNKLKHRGGLTHATGNKRRVYMDENGINRMG